MEHQSVFGCVISTRGGDPGLPGVSVDSASQAVGQGDPFRAGVFPGHAVSGAGFLRHVLHDALAGGRPLAVCLHHRRHRAGGRRRHPPGRYGGKTGSQGGCGGRLCRAGRLVRADLEPGAGLQGPDHALGVQPGDQPQRLDGPVQPGHDVRRASLGLARQAGSRQAPPPCRRASGDRHPAETHLFPGLQQPGHYTDALPAARRGGLQLPQVHRAGSQKSQCLLQHGHRPDQAGKGRRVHRILPAGHGHRPAVRRSGVPDGHGPCQGWPDRGGHRLPQPNHRDAAEALRGVSLSCIKLSETGSHPRSRSGPPPCRHHQARSGGRVLPIGPAGPTGTLAG